MVSLEIEKPSTWNMARKMGIIAVIFLIVGPFLPYVISEYRFGDQVTGGHDFTYFNFEWAGLFMLLPIISAFLIVFLLYFKFDIYIEKDTSRKNIKPFILMAWGFWFFLTYLAEAIRIGEEQESFGYTFSQFAGYGSWMIVLGFLLGGLAGFLEWRYPTMTGPAIAIPKRAKAEPAAQPAPEAAAPQPATQEVTPVEAIEPTPEPAAAPAAPKPAAEPEPAPAAPATTGKMEVITREPASDEEKALIRWARHINVDGQTFEQCLKCKNYVFISAKDAGDAITFKCPDCGGSFTLKK